MKLNTSKTINSIFMVPTLGINIAILKQHGYIGGYGRDNNRNGEFLDDVVYTLFKPNNLDAFKIFLENQYAKSNYIVEDYDYEEGYIVVIYALLPEFKNDYNLIRQGKYSATSKKFQALFSSHVYILEEGVHVKQESIQYKIFNRSEDLIAYWEEKIGQTLYPDQELWDMYVEEKETLKL